MKRHPLLCINGKSFRTNRTFFEFVSLNFSYSIRYSHGMHGNQRFNYLPETKQLFHPITNHCLDCNPEKGELFMNPCDDKKKSQKWSWGRLNLDLIRKRNQIASPEIF